MRIAAALMGTVFEVSVPDGTDEGLVSDVFAWWREVEERFSTFRSGSEISRIRRGELTVDDATGDVRHVLAVCDELSEATGGRFDARSDERLDPSGYVKGWSVDEAVLMLQGAGVSDFAVYAGGDVRCVGSPTDAPAWSVGLRLPWDRDAVGAVLEVRDGAVATSGRYERGDHIWGAAQERRLEGVSVLGPRLGIADALATAIYADQGSSWEWLGGFDDYSVVVFTADRQVRWSPRLEGSITLGSVSPPGDEQRSQHYRREQIGDPDLLEVEQTQ
jgi:thiamine biosynthesis lipoprotein